MLLQVDGSVLILWYFWNFSWFGSTAIMYHPTVRCPYLCLGLSHIIAWELHSCPTSIWLITGSETLAPSDPCFNDIPETLIISLPKHHWCHLDTLTTSLPVLDRYLGPSTLLYLSISGVTQVPTHLLYICLIDIRDHHHMFVWASLVSHTCPHTFSTRATPISRTLTASLLSITGVT